MCHGTPNNLSQQCIQSKYVHDSYIIKFNKGYHTWQDIGKGWNLLPLNCHEVLGDGRSALFWEDNWTGLGTTRNRIYGPLNKGEYKLTVHECRASNSWNFDKISFRLPSMVRIKIEGLVWKESLNANNLCSSFVIDNQFSLTKSLRVYIHLDPV